MGRPLRRALNFQRTLTCTITLADGRQLVTLRDAVDVLNEAFANCRTLECGNAMRLLVEAGTTGESADIALATVIVERLLRDRRLL